MRILSAIKRICEAWLAEVKCIFKDEGALLFCILLPLGYPILYSWIYNNEVVREVPAVVVDDSHSALSREFIQKVDASADVCVAQYCGSIDEARKVIGHGDAYGIIYFPEDFAIRTNRMEQAHVSVYCDMSYMLFYKAIYQTCTNVSGIMGAELQSMLLGNYTDRENEISAKPLDYDDVPMFNTTGGYGNFVLPGVLVLILQQAMLLGIGLVSGSDREKGYQSVKGVVSSLCGKGMAYFMIFAVMAAYVTLVIPHLFGFVSLVHAWDLTQLMVPYLLSCVFFGICFSDLVRYRENIMLIVVFTSVPFLFLSGVSWPQSNMPGFWQGVADIVPSSFGIRGFIRMSSMGARAGDIAPEIQTLWLQVIVYGVLACAVMYRRYCVRCSG